MKTRLLPVFLVTLLLFLSAPVSAHPGRTDESGGHFVGDTGEYHYHHGYEAHQHSDIDGDGILDCPYDFDDKTDSGSSGISSGEYSHVLTVKPDESEDIPVDSSDGDNKHGSPTSIVFDIPWAGSSNHKEESKNLRAIVEDMISYVLDIRLRELPVHLLAVAASAFYGYFAAAFLVGVLCYIIEKITKKPVQHAGKFIVIAAIIFSVVLLLMCLYDSVS